MLQGSVHNTNCKRTEEWSDYHLRCFSNSRIHIKRHVVEDGFQKSEFLALGCTTKDAIYCGWLAQKQYNKPSEWCICKRRQAMQWKNRVHSKKRLFCGSWKKCPRLLRHFNTSWPAKSKVPTEHRLWLY